MQLSFRGHDLVLDASGALWWPKHALLVVADLHLEKASAFARRGRFLPPYDTEATLARVETLVARFRPATVVSLGDGFHDRQGPAHLPAGLFDRLSALTRSVRWVWVTGNHDPELPLTLGGAAVPELRLDGLVLRHLPSETADGEIAGHLHPKARVLVRGRTLRRPCFAVGDARIIMPALGSLTGGLNVLDPALMAFFAGRFAAYLAGQTRVHPLPRRVLLPDAARHTAHTGGLGR